MIESNPSVDLYIQRAYANLQRDEFPVNEWRAYTPGEIRVMGPQKYERVWNHLVAECTRLGISTSHAEAEWYWYESANDENCFETLQQAVIVARAKESVDMAAKKFIDESL